MEAVAFENAIIKAHPFYRQCGATLETVSKKDYPNNDYFDTSILCLDMDAYEIATRRGQQKETVDAVIGVKDYRQNRFTNQRLLLVELRMNYNNVNNLSKSKLEDKVRHTRELLGAGTPIETYSWFVFKNSKIEQAKRWFEDQSRAGGDIKHFIPLSTDMFNDSVKREQDFPYKPITDLDILRSDLQKYANLQDLHEFDKRKSWWHKKANEYKYQKNNSNEYRCIVAVIKDVWSELRPTLLQHTLSEEESLYMEIIDEEIQLYR